MFENCFGNQALSIDSVLTFSLFLIGSFLVDALFLVPIFTLLASSIHMETLCKYPHRSSGCQPETPTWTSPHSLGCPSTTPTLNSLLLHPENKIDTITNLGANQLPANLSSCGYPRLLLLLGLHPLLKHVDLGNYLPSNLQTFQTTPLYP